MIPFGTTEEHQNGITLRTRSFFLTIFSLAPQQHLLLRIFQDRQLPYTTRYFVGDKHQILHSFDPELLYEVSHEPVNYTEENKELLTKWDLLPLLPKPLTPHERILRDIQRFQKTNNLPTEFTDHLTLLLLNTRMLQPQAAPRTFYYEPATCSGKSFALIEYEENSLPNPNISWMKKAGFTQEEIQKAELILTQSEAAATALEAHLQNAKTKPKPVKNIRVGPGSNQNLLIRIDFHTDLSNEPWENGSKGFKL